MFVWDILTAAGTGSKFGILASFVKGVKIMGADGQVWNCQSGGEHHALFKAAQCHLGGLWVCSFHVEEGS